MLSPLSNQLSLPTAHEVPDDHSLLSRYHHLVMPRTNRGHPTDRRCGSAGDFMVEHVLVFFFYYWYIENAYMRIRQTQHAGIASHLAKAKSQL